MAVNTTPIFVGTPRNSFASSTTNVNTLFDGTGTVVTVFTAGANGSKLETVNMWNLGANNATVIRFFLNNGSTNSTAANNALINEITWATNAATQVQASVPVIWNANLYMPAGYKLNVTVGATIASGVMVSAQGGDF